MLLQRPENARRTADVRVVNSTFDDINPSPLSAPPFIAFQSTSLSMVGVVLKNVRNEVS